MTADSSLGWNAKALLGIVLFSAATATPKVPNMNGDYILSQTPGGKDTQKRFPTHFSDYPGGVSYFEVYSPLITSLYSQVFWKGLDPVDLPVDVVQKFDGKGMAVVGFEMDQVRREKDGDVSVPISVAYNHHFESHMVGKHAVFEKVHFDGPDDPRLKMMDMGHGLPSHKEHWMVRDLGTSSGKLPTTQDFGGANGGEYRKSFHGYAPGYAQVIDSPRQFQITPMQIDTWHRDKMNLSHPTKFVPGPLPRNSLAPTGVDALYSGMLECPVTTRIRKDIGGTYITEFGGNCGTSIETASECFSAAAEVLGKVGPNASYTSISDTSRPQGCSAVVDGMSANTAVVYFNRAGSSVKCGTGATHLAGSTSSLVHLTVSLDISAQVATITVVGPAGVWFGVGFNASAMKDAPWAIVVDGEGKVTERKLADQSPGKTLDVSVSVKESTLIGGTRKVTMTRPFKGLTADYFSFDPNSGMELNFINAVGVGPAFAYHKEKAPSSILLLPVVDGSSGGSGACICASHPAPFGKAKGSITYVQTSQAADTGSGKVSFGNNCAPQPRSDLLAMKNPTCDLRTYVGGQIACHHMWSLLDADQEIPWPDRPLEYHLKFRFWVQEYNASYHTNLQRTTWGIASPVEYDVPKCAPGIMGCEQQPDGNWIHTITGTFTGSGLLSAAHFHCHAPTCLSIAMYVCPKGTKVCNARTGKLLCKEEPVYGGTGRIDDQRFDEPGYILQPPCLWGSPEFGLEPPPDVSGKVLGSVKTSNATYGHHGEMAWQQMYYFTARDTAFTYI